MKKKKNEKKPETERTKDYSSAIANWKEKKKKEGEEKKRKDR